jgi:hypothetical protein
MRQRWVARAALEPKPSALSTFAEIHHDRSNIGCRREADIAGCGYGRRSWAESALAGHFWSAEIRRRGRAKREFQAEPKVWRGGSESAALPIASRRPMGFQAALMAWIIGCTRGSRSSASGCRREPNGSSRSHLFERSHPEVGSAHPRLDGPERMFCGLTSDAHTRGRSVQPLLHRVEDGFVLPSLDAPFFGRRVLRFHIADRRGQLGDFPKGPAFVLAPVERVRPEGLQ